MFKRDDEDKSQAASPERVYTDFGAKEEVSGQFLVQVLSRESFVRQVPEICLQVGLEHGEEPLLAGGDAEDRIVLLQDPKLKVWGGCLLRRKAAEIECTDEAEARIFASHLFFNLSDDSPIHEDAVGFNALVSGFYTDLRAVIESYAEAHGCTVFMLQSWDEYAESLEFGKWRYSETFKLFGDQRLSVLSPSESVH